MRIPVHLIRCPAHGIVHPEGVIHNAEPYPTGGENVTLDPSLAPERYAIFGVHSDGGMTPISPAPERKGTFELLTDIVASWEKDMRALLAAKDSEIEKWKAWEAQEREDKTHQQARADKAEARAERLAAALESYGWHTLNCSYPGGCNCGLAAALAEEVKS